LQRERRNQVEPRCAERWHGCGNTEMMSNSTFLRPFGSKRTSSSGRLVSFTQIKSWPCVASFYRTLIYRFPLNSFLSVLRVAVIKLGDEKNAYPSPFCQGKSRKFTL
jgi:hypothetical protein